QRLLERVGVLGESVVDRFGEHRIGSGAVTDLSHRGASRPRGGILGAPLAHKSQVLPFPALDGVGEVVGARFGDVGAAARYGWASRLVLLSGGSSGHAPSGGSVVR